MTTPGWYNDEREAGLARWHDGRGWTANTLVIADWHSDSEPPPPANDVSPPIDDEAPAAVDGDRPPWFDETSAMPVGQNWDDGGWPDEEWYDEDGAPAPRHGAGRPVGIDWRRYGAPIGVLAALLLAVLAFQAVGGDDGAKDLDAEETAAFGDIDAAVTAARRGLAGDISLGDSELKALIRGLCDVADGGSPEMVAQDAAGAVASSEQLDPVLSAAARGAASYCPRATGAGGAVDEIAAAAALRLGATTTLADGSTIDPAAPTLDSSSSGAAGATTKATTRPTARSSGSDVVRTETRRQSSTGNNSSGTSDNVSGDVEETGNSANNNQSTNTVVTAPPPAETPPQSDPEPAEPPPAE